MEPIRLSKTYRATKGLMILPSKKKDKDDMLFGELEKKAICLSHYYEEDLFSKDSLDIDEKGRYIWAENGRVAVIDVKKSLGNTGDPRDEYFVHADIQLMPPQESLTGELYVLFEKLGFEQEK